MKFRNVKIMIMFVAVVMLVTVCGCVAPPSDTGLNGDGSVFYDGNFGYLLSKQMDTQMGQSLGYGLKIMANASVELSGEIVIPSEYNGYPVLAIADGGFAGCTKITGVTISDGVASIGANAFSLCSSLEKVELGEKVTEIGYSAFKQCEALKEIVIPENSRLEFIGESAFENCGLTWLYIPEKLSTMYTSATIGLENLEEITVHGKNKAFKIIDGALYDIDGETLLLYPAARQGEALDIAEGTAYIAGRAFAFNRSIREIRLPSTVRDIDNYAFYGCKSLEKVTVAERSQLTAIHYGAFMACGMLKEAVINGGVDRLVIWKYAFMDCKALERVVLPENLSEIKAPIFNSHVMSELIIYAKNPPVISEEGSSLFADESPNVTVYVPAESIALYKQQWNFLAESAFKAL